MRQPNTRDGSTNLRAAQSAAYFGAHKNRGEYYNIQLQACEGRVCEANPGQRFLTSVDGDGTFGNHDVTNRKLKAAAIVRALAGLGHVFILRSRG